MSKSILYWCASLLGFEKDPASVSNSENDDDWGDTNPRLTQIREQLEYYFSGINLEKDNVFLAEISKSPERYVSVDFILNCKRMEILEASVDDVLDAADESYYLESDRSNKRVRSKMPFVPDPNRAQRVLRISGIGSKVPQVEQLDFFRSIFGDNVEQIHLIRKEQDGEIVYTNSTLVEFATPEVAKEVFERGIQYGDSSLDIKPYAIAYDANKQKKQDDANSQEKQKEKEQQTDNNEKPQTTKTRNLKGRGAKPKSS